MEFFTWISQISQSAAPPGQPFSAHWWYVVMALVIPVLMGVVLAGILRLLEKALGMKLGGGSV